MATTVEVQIKRYIGTAAEFATYQASGSTDPVGSTYWAWDTNVLYKTIDGTAANYKLYVTLG